MKKILSLWLALAILVGGCSAPYVPGPGPDPGPNPPTPVDPSPIPAEGFRVLIVVESAELSKLPAKQLSILSAKEVVDYCKTKCVKTNGHPDFRVWDQNVDVSRDPSAGMKAAFALPRQSVPWLIVSNGKTGYAGPLPATVTDMLTLLKKYGG